MDFICLPIILFSGLILISILTSFFTARLGVPLILLFILVGLFLGSAHMPFVTADSLTAKNVFFVGSVALALILFDSGFNTSLNQFKAVATPAVLLASVGVAIGALLTAPVVMYLLKTSFTEGLLLGSIIGSTDAAAVFFLLSSNNLFLRERVKLTLESESGTNDPMAIFLTFVCLTLLNHTDTSDQNMAVTFLFELLQQAGIGSLGGYILFVALHWVLIHFNLRQPLFPLFVLAFVMLGFALITLAGGSGYLAVYLCGLWLGNTPLKAHTTLLKFQQTIIWLCQILLFTILGLFVKSSHLVHVFWKALGIGLCLIFLIRPIMVITLLSFFKRYKFSEKVFISFVGLRGATSVLMALTPLVFGFSFGDQFFNTVFVLVLLSLSFQGYLIPYVAKKCRVLTHPPVIPKYAPGEYKCPPHVISVTVHDKGKDISFSRIIP